MVEHLTSGSGHDLTVCEFEPASSFVLIAQSLEPALDSVSPSLSLYLPHSRSVSLSKTKTLKKKF